MSDLDALIAEADAAVEHAQSTRRYHARRTRKGSKQRETDLRLAADRLLAAMRPIRREAARWPFQPQSAASEASREGLRQASIAIQRERRKLWKMRKTPR